MDEVVISKEMLKAIGGETRLKILKALKERQKTQSELAKELSLAPPTILEHVTKLEKAGLVERMEEDRERKWKYYRLTKTSRDMLGRKRMNIVLMLSYVSAVATAGLILLYIVTPMIVSGLLGESAAPAPPPEPQTGAASNIKSSLTSLEQSSQTFLGFFAMILLLLTIILFLVGQWLRSRKR